MSDNAVPIPNEENATSRFPKTVMVQIHGRWHVVVTACQALDCLVNRFPERQGPSYTRAVDTCEALLIGRGSPEGAQAAFIVSAMASGHQFEVHDDGIELDERLAVVAAENGLIDLLLELESELT